MKSYAKITAQGAYVPEKVMTNEDFEEIVEKLEKKLHA